MTATMRRLLALILLSLTLPAIWCVWKLQPWMRPNYAIHLGSWCFGKWEFQIWQRKTATLTEPFATGLFVRREEGPWRAFLLDFEDLYRPGLVLRSRSNGVALLQHNKERWFFDLSTERLRRKSGGEEFTGGVIHNAPPGNWWLQLSDQPP